MRTDALPLAQLAEHTFRETFASTNTPEDMDAHCRATYSDTLQAEEITHPQMATLLCEEHGNLVGFAQVRWHRVHHGVVALAPGEVQRLYVERDWHGRGIAQALMQAALEVLAEQGCDVVWLGVWEHNPRAIAFYTTFGFVAVSEHTFTVGSDPQRDIVMARPLGRAATLRPVS